MKTQTPYRSRALIFLLVAGIAAAFALYTHHVWEDYYITYRSSKNLATGHGLVFNWGDRLHTFTSPLGVLLPAVASLLTFNSSDAAALWIFRLMSCFALGGAALLILRLTESLRYARLTAILMIGWLALDSKLVDFAINGMETAFLILFLTYTLWAHLTPGPKAWRHLGIAWAGLMWSRPDSFIYIGLIGAGIWLFNDPARTGANRRQLLVTFVRAGLVTTALYLPWLLFCWGYYGTPIPHTITAKSGIGDPRTLVGLFKTVANLPFSAWTGTGSMEATFLPAYYMIGGWPAYLVQAARGLAIFCSLLWVVPFLRMETRATSLAFFGAHAYLSYYPYFPFPWYIPSTTLLAIYCLGSLLAQGLAVAEDWKKLHATSLRPNQVLSFALVVVGIILAANIWTTWQSARLFAAQQRYVEDGNRRKIGEWLHANGQPGDAVFMEPLGYIGFFSGLKTYDFPGMSSREMVAARKKVGVSWAKLIVELRPQWVVLRPSEVQRVSQEDYDLLTSDYQPAKEFSVAEQLDSLDIHGLPYLQFDAKFTVFKRLPPNSRLAPVSDTSPFPINQVQIDNKSVTLAHAPSTLVRAVPLSAQKATVQFGFVPTAYTEADHQTDGAIFSVELMVGNRITVLATRTLTPATNPADRGLQSFTFELPGGPDPARLFLKADPKGTMERDWTCWGEVVFQ